MVRRDSVEKRLERQQTSLTTLTDSDMRSALLRLDNSLKFIGQVNPNTVPVETLADKNAEMLEAMRLDTATVSDKAYISACQRLRVKPEPRNAPAKTRANQSGSTLSAADQRTLEAMRVDLTVSAQSYRNACAKFGVQPQPRPSQPVLTAQQAIVPFHVQGAAWTEFMQAHGELFQEPFSSANIKIITQWLSDEQRQSDAASLAQCYAECSAAGYFRDVRVLARDMSESMKIVHPYNHAELVAMRRQQGVDAATATPAGLSDVDRDVWQAVHAKYPQLPVGSPAFKKCCSQTLVLWARQYCIENDPSLANGNDKGDSAALRKAIDAVLVQWARLSNPGLRIGAGSNKSGGTKIWLGTIWL